MDLAQAVFPALPLLELGGRVLLAAALGAAIGIERELTDQPAGLRTHMLVALGAMLFTAAGAYAAGPFLSSSQVRFDPTRVAAQVVTGIGFLGAGAIIRQGFTVQGLTTAAGLWVTAAVGLAVGLGYYAGAVFTTLITVLALYGMKQLERGWLRKLKPGRYDFRMKLSHDLKLSSLSDVIEGEGGKIASVQIDTEDGGFRLATIYMLLMPGTRPEHMAEILEDIEGISEVDWSR